MNPSKKIQKYKLSGVGASGHLILSFIEKSGSTEIAADIFAKGYGQEINFGLTSEVSKINFNLICATQTNNSSKSLREWKVSPSELVYSKSSIGSPVESKTKKLASLDGPVVCPLGLIYFAQKNIVEIGGVPKKVFLLTELNLEPLELFSAVETPSELKIRLCDLTDDPILSALESNQAQVVFDLSTGELTQIRYSPLPFISLKLDLEK